MTDTLEGKLSKVIQALTCGIVALLCFSCSGSLKPFSDYAAAEGEWFVALMLARFGFIAAGFVLIIVATVKLVKAL